MSIEEPSLFRTEKGDVKMLTTVEHVRHGGEGADETQLGSASSAALLRSKQVQPWTNVIFVIFK